MSSSSIAMIIAMTLILAGPGRVVPAQEMKDAKPKKPSFEKTDLTLTDNKTGLTWTLNGNLAERQFSWNGSFDYIERRINKDGYAGVSDWRMPTKEELTSLVGLVKSQGYDGMSSEKSFSAGLAALGFQNVQDDGYWSSSENRYFAGEVFVVKMTDGAAAITEKTLYFNLWPVRSSR
jgi:hypothetical protein